MLFSTVQVPCWTPLTLRNGQTRTVQRDDGAKLFEAGQLEVIQKYARFCYCFPQYPDLL